jgi:hypothetical protein
MGATQMAQPLFGRLGQLDARRQHDAPGAPAIRLDPQLAADVPQALVDVLQHVVDERAHAPRALRRPAEIDARAARLEPDQMMAVLAAGTSISRASSAALSPTASSSSARISPG